jgi:hypothetical protein
MGQVAKALHSHLHLLIMDMGVCSFLSALQALHRTTGLIAVYVLTNRS